MEDLSSKRASTTENGRIIAIGEKET